MTRLTVAVTYRENVGFESTASHEVGRSYVADSLRELRRKITVATLMKRRKGEDLIMGFTLDPAARAEWDRRVRM
jgi:hypothetical protein